MGEVLRLAAAPSARALAGDWPVKELPEEIYRLLTFGIVPPIFEGPMAGLMKDFFDRTYYPALDRINGRP